MEVAAIENDKYLIRPVTDTDKVPFMRIRKENSDMSRAYDNKMFFDYLWAAVLRSRDDVSMVVFLKENGSLIAVCSFRDVNTGAISIGIDNSAVYGTPRFMAPEIVLGKAKPSRNTDLYSLAVLLFYMFMMGHPLEGKLEADIRCMDIHATAWYDTCR